jgi:hypothetical protein
MLLSPAEPAVAVSAETRLQRLLKLETLQESYGAA